jgi:two-component system, sensor histidine kinase PdtaS
MKGKILLALVLGISAFATHAQRAERDSLITLLKTDIHDTTRSLAMVRLINLYAAMAPDTALSYGREALSFIDGKKLDKYKPAVLGAMGNAYLVKGEYNTAESYFRNVLAEAIRRKDDNLRSRAYNSLGILFLYKPDYDSSIYYNEKQLEFERLADRKNALANSYNNIGIAYYYKGNYPLSLQYYLKALHERENQTPVKNDAVSTCLLNIGEVYAKMQDYQKSLEYYYQANAWTKGEGSVNYHNATLQASIGKSHYLMGAIDSAFYYQLSSLDIYKKLGIKSGIASNTHHLALLYKHKEEWANALKEETSALELFRQLGDERGIAESHLLLGEVNLKLKKYAQAKAMALEGLKMAEVIKAREIQKNILLLLSNVSEAMRDFPQAHSYRNRYDALKDSIFSDEKTRQIANMEALYENDKKNAEIELLQQRAEVQNLTIARGKLTRNITIAGALVLAAIVLLLWNRYRLKQRSNAALEKLSASLQQSLNEKELLLKEIHHRVKNNLQVISSLLSLQSRTQRDEKIIEAMKEGQNRVKSMALIHQKLYQNEDISSISFLDYTQDLLDYLFNTYHNTQKNIRYHIEPFDLKLDVDTAVPLGLIMNELISNSLKYAFNNVQEGIINVAMKPLGQQGRLRLEVSDNGQGLPENFDHEKSGSMGLRLVRSLSRQLQAELTISNNNGLAYVLDFSVA